MKDKPILLRLQARQKNLALLKNKSPIDSNLKNYQKVTHCSTAANLYNQNQQLPKIYTKIKNPRLLAKLNNKQNNENKQKQILKIDKVRSNTPFFESKYKIFYTKTLNKSPDVGMFRVRTVDGMNISQNANTSQLLSTTVNQKTIPELNNIQKRFSSNSSTIKKQLQILTALKKKINEQNKIILTRDKEIEYYKNNYNNNHFHTMVKSDKFLQKELKEINENETNEEIEKYKNEISSLKEKIESLEIKYESKEKDRNEVQQKYDYLKNSVLTQNELKSKYENRISKQEKTIIDLEEQINQYKINENRLKKKEKEKEREKEKEKEKEKENMLNHIESNNIEKSKINKKVLEISNINYFGIIAHNENNKNKQNYFFLSDEMFDDIFLLIKAILTSNSKYEQEVQSYIEKISNENIEEYTNKFCELLNITNNNQIINKFLSDCVNKKCFSESNINFQYNKDENNNDQNTIIDNQNFNNFIIKRCEEYDYKGNGFVNFEYFKHVYDEYLYKNKLIHNKKHFFKIICNCKSNFIKETKTDIFDIFYTQLKKSTNNNNINDIENENKIISVTTNKINTNLKYGELINEFLNNLIVGALGKYEEKLKACDRRGKLSYTGPKNLGYFTDFKDDNRNINETNNINVSNNKSENKNKNEFEV